MEIPSSSAKDMAAKRTSNGDEFIVGVGGAIRARQGLSALWTRTTASGVLLGPHCGEVSHRHRIRRSREPQEIIPIRGPRSSWTSRTLDVARVRGGAGQAPWSQITSLSAEKVALWGGSDDGGVLNGDLDLKPRTRPASASRGLRPGWRCGQVIVFGGTTLAGERR